jgi:flavin reductase (DIM6/NTAB) family NADH-FMN oxidoreductase RutF
MGHFASGVVVVTAVAADGAPLGFTCQTFTSLSLDPPLVSFSPARTSASWPQIRDVGRFCINVLAAQHRAVSDAFARSGTDKFAGVSWRSGGRTGAPVLDDVCAWIECLLVGEYDGGDHTIAVGRVLDLDADPEQSPLLFHRGRYGIANGDARGPRPPGWSR